MWPVPRSPSKKAAKRLADAAEAIGEGLQAFCIPGSVAEQRKVGLGHGNLGRNAAASEETKCFCFLAGHESFCRRRGRNRALPKLANKVRKQPLQRDPERPWAKTRRMIISRINGFTYVQTEYDYATGELKIVKEIALLRTVDARESTLLRRGRRARRRSRHAQRGCGRIHHR